LLKIPTEVGDSMALRHSFPIEKLESRKQLEGYTRELGTEIFGIASAASYAKEFPHKPSPSLFVKDAKSIIVIGIPFEPTTLATVNRSNEIIPFYTDWDENNNRLPLAARQSLSYAAHSGPPSTWFLHDEKNLIFGDLYAIAYRIAKWLRTSGWTAFYTQPSKKDRGSMQAAFYHMPAMYLAGLGTLGLNCCILTPDFGPRVLVTSIITNCDFESDLPLDYEVCDKCLLCVEACPVGALDGLGWKDIYLCRDKGGCCSRCIVACPVGST
jgi:epoxyqueuosine reductase QueG